MDPRIQTSIIIPAFNEEAELPAVLKALRFARQRGDTEIIVVDNNSTDRTAEIATQFGARVIREPHNQISRARNAGAANAQGFFFIFLDADTLLPEELFVAIQNRLTGKKLCGGGALVAFNGDPPPSLIRMTRVWNRISRTFQVAAGSLIFCRRDAFDDIGGFSNAVYAGEEIFFSRNLKRWGNRQNLPFRILHEFPPVKTSPRKIAWHGLTKSWFAHLLLVLFPFLVRSRKFCGFWYNRPISK